MSDLKAEIELLQDLESATEEFDAAQLVRKEDPERWEAAKEAFQAKRSFWRGVNHSLTRPSDDTVSPTELSGTIQIHKDKKEK